MEEMTRAADDDLLEHRLAPGRSELAPCGDPTERAMLRVVEIGSALGSATLGFTILVDLEQGLRLNALAPVAILLAVVAVAACLHAILRFRMALAALVLASAALIAGFGSVELFPSADPSLALALSFTDPAVTVGAVGLAMLAAIAGISEFFSEPRC